MKNLVILLAMSLILSMTIISCKKENSQPEPQITNPPNPDPQDTSSIDTIFSIDFQGFYGNLSYAGIMNFKVIPIITQYLPVNFDNSIITFDMQIKNDSIYIIDDNTYWKVKYDSILILDAYHTGLDPDYWPSEYGDSITNYININVYRKIKQNQIIISDTNIYNHSFYHTYKPDYTSAKKYYDTININNYR